MKIKKEDQVIVISGKDKGKKGRVLRVIPKYNKIIVENVNVVKKHQKPTQQIREGGIIEQPMPVDVSKVMLVDPSTGTPTRVGYKFLEDGTKVRYAKKSGEIVDKA